MSKILEHLFSKGGKSPCKLYEDTALFFQELERESNLAIQCLYSKTTSSIYYLGRSHQLNDNDIEELICDCIVECILKIRQKKYIYQGFDPASYVIEIAKYKSKNYYRKIQKNTTVELESNLIPEEEDDPSNAKDMELVEELLQSLDKNCQNLIRLKYLKEKKDHEIIQGKLTQYTTVDALKNHRSKCMKKLVLLSSNILGKNN